MTWVRRTQSPPPAHECAPPTHYEPIWYVADGGHGDLWRCDDCGRLWRNDAGRWERANWWQQIRYFGAGRPMWGSAVKPIPMVDYPGQRTISTAELPERPAVAPPPPGPSGRCRHDH